MDPSQTSTDGQVRLLESGEVFAIKNTVDMLRGRLEILETRAPPMLSPSPPASPSGDIMQVISKTKDDLECLIVDLVGEVATLKADGHHNAEALRSELQDLREQVQRYAGSADGPVTPMLMPRLTSDEIAVEAGERAAADQKLESSLKECRKSLVHGLKEAWKEIQCEKSERLALAASFTELRRRVENDFSNGKGGADIDGDLASDLGTDRSDGDRRSIQRAMQSIDDLKKQVARVYDWVTSHVSLQLDALRSDMEANGTVTEREEPATALDKRRDPGKSGGSSVSSVASSRVAAPRQARRSPGESKVASPRVPPAKASMRSPRRDGPTARQ